MEHDPKENGLCGIINCTKHESCHHVDTTQNKPTCCVACEEYIPEGPDAGEKYCLKETCTCHTQTTPYERCVEGCPCRSIQYATPREEWEKEFDECFAEYKNGNQGWLDETQAKIVRNFIRETRTAAYEKGQQDAFEGRIENMRTITIHETLDVPEPLREHFRKEGYEKGVRDSLEVVEGMKGILWSDDKDEYLMRLHRHGTLNEVNTAISTLLK